MKTRGILIYMALAAMTSPAFAAYSEQWVSTSNIAKAQTPSTRTTTPGAGRKKETKASVVNVTEDDPIAAFAHPHQSTQHVQVSK